MKKTRVKLLAFLLAAVMVLSPLYSTIPAAAANGDTSTISTEDDNSTPKTLDSSNTNSTGTSSLSKSVSTSSSSSSKVDSTSTSSSSKTDSTSTSSTSKTDSSATSSSSKAASSSSTKAGSDTPAAPQYPKSIAYSGETVTLQNAEGSVFKMLAPQEGTTCVLNGDNVEITIIPKNTTVYNALHYGLITDAELTKDLAFQADGSIVLTLGKENCGSGIAVAPLKADGSGTTKDQYYLCIPAEDKLPKAEPTVPTKIPYSGDKVTFQKEDGSEFGMLAPQEGSSCVLNGDKVEIKIIPKNTTVYGALHYGLITDAELTQDVVFQADGSIVFEIGKENCGYGIAIAPVKKSDGKTSKDQYYLCIPAEDKLPKAEPTVPTKIPYSGDKVTFQKEDGSEFGMLAPQEGSSCVLNGDKVEIKIIPKNTTVYGALHYGLITDAELTQDVVFQTDGSIVFEIGKENCGYGIAIAPVKKSDGKTSKDQYYLCIPTEDKLNPADESAVDLTIANLTKMFKAATASYSAKENGGELTVAMSGSGYHEFFKGIYEDALANGMNKDNWIHGYQNSDKKWEFVIPVGEGEKNIPIVSISDSHLKKVEAGEETLDQALFARMFVLDLENKMLTVGDYDAVVDISVVSKTDSFKVESAGTMQVIGSPSSNNYACNPTITMKDAAYTKTFIGTAADAAKEGAAVIELTESKFAFVFVNTQETKTFEDKKPIAVAFYDAAKSAWADFKLTIDKAASTVTIEALAQDEPAPTKPEGNNSNTNNNTSAQTKAADASTTLADGTYTPESFGYSGGTGKVAISCTQIEVRNGQAYATIVFSKPNGGAASVDAVRAAGGEYTGNNTFVIPVDLNTNMTIYGCTTAMSQPHWVEYTIFIGLTEPGKDTSNVVKVTDNKDTLDQTAPTIPGIKSVGEVKVEYTDLFKIYEYENGYYLIEMNLYEDTYRDSVEYRKAAIAAEKEEAAGNNTVQESSYDEEGNYIAAQSDSEKIAELYKNEVVKYLVVPEGKQVPAGLEKELIVIRQPADKTYVSSAEALEYLMALKADGNITAIGIAEEEIKDEAIKARLALDKGEEGRIVFAGEYDDWDIKTLLLEKNNFAISSSKILPNDKETVEEDLENLIRLAERANQLDGMAMFIDRSADEKNDLAKAEWNKVYGIIYGQKDAAEQLYKAAVDGATEEEKTAALQTKDERTKTRNANAEAAKNNAE